MRRIQVNTGNPYEIWIERGLLQKTAETLKPYRERKLLLLSDTNTKKYFADKIEEDLRKHGYQIVSYTVPSGEEAKSLQVFGALLEFMAENEFHRDAILIAVGGGVVGDLGGFAASAYLRGIDFIQIPTSLLAAVDSSVGGKTGVNLAAGKNLAGAFHQPRQVLLDPDVFSSLPESEWKSGVAEVLKYGILRDGKFFARIAEGLRPDDSDLEECIEFCVRSKAEIVSADERDHGIRQTLNLGHTFGHAIEAASAFTIPHGQAVAIGMAMMARACRKRGITQTDIVERIENALTANGLPTVSPYPPEALIQAMKKDKKAVGDSIRLVVIEGIGKCHLQNEALIGWLEDTQ